MDKAANVLDSWEQTKEKHPLATMAASFVPGVGSGTAAMDSANEFRKGNVGSGVANAGIAALGLLPGGTMIGKGVAKGLGAVGKAVGLGSSAAGNANKLVRAGQAIGVGTTEAAAGLKGYAQSVVPTAQMAASFASVAAQLHDQKRQMNKPEYQQQLQDHQKMVDEFRQWQATRQKTASPYDDVSSFANTAAPYALVANMAMKAKPHLDNEDPLRAMVGAAQGAAGTGLGYLGMKGGAQLGQMLGTRFGSGSPHMHAILGGLAGAYLGNEAGSSIAENMLMPQPAFGRGRGYGYKYAAAKPIGRERQNVPPDNTPGGGKRLRREEVQPKNFGDALKKKPKPSVGKKPPEPLQPPGPAPKVSGSPVDPVALPHELLQEKYYQHWNTDGLADKLHSLAQGQVIPPHVQDGPVDPTRPLPGRENGTGPMFNGQQADPVMSKGLPPSVKGLLADTIPGPTPQPGRMQQMMQFAGKHKVGTAAALAALGTAGYMGYRGLSGQQSEPPPQPELEMKSAASLFRSAGRAVGKATRYAGNHKVGTTAAVAALAGGGRELLEAKSESDRLYGDHQTEMKSAEALFGGDRAAEGREQFLNRISSRIKDRHAAGKGVPRLNVQKLDATATRMGERFATTKQATLMDKLKALGDGIGRGGERIGGAVASGLSAAGGKLRAPAMQAGSNAAMDHHQSSLFSPPPQELAAVHQGGVDSFLAGQGRLGQGRDWAGRMLERAGAAAEQHKAMLGGGVAGGAAGLAGLAGVGAMMGGNEEKTAGLKDIMAAGKAGLSSVGQAIGGTVGGVGNALQAPAESAATAAYTASRNRMESKMWDRGTTEWRKAMDGTPGGSFDRAARFSTLENPMLAGKIERIANRKGDVAKEQHLADSGMTGRAQNWTGRMLSRAGEVAMNHQALTGGAALGAGGLLAGKAMLGGGSEPSEQPNQK